MENDGFGQSITIIRREEETVSEVVQGFMGLSETDFNMLLGAAGVVGMAIILFLLYNIVTTGLSTRQGGANLTKADGSLRGAKERDPDKFRELRKSRQDS
ncbi:MAG: hypothetical protein AAFQ36_08495 [Pseudomonadota bacterium]